jgi:hypothetical protein
VTKRRKVEFCFGRRSSRYLELNYNDPLPRWCFPFQFIDSDDLEDALRTAGLPLEIARLSEPRVCYVTNDQLDVLAYWQQAGRRTFEGAGAVSRKRARITNA